MKTLTITSITAALFALSLSAQALSPTEKKWEEQPYGSDSAKIYIHKQVRDTQDRPPMAYQLTRAKFEGATFVTGPLSTEEAFVRHIHSVEGFPAAGSEIMEKTVPQAYQLTREKFESNFR